MYSDNGGETWTADEGHPYQAGVNSMTVDPRDSCKVYYATGGRGFGTALLRLACLAAEAGRDCLGGWMLHGLGCQ